MGLFDFLFGGKSASRARVEDDRVWMSQEAKFNGIRKDVAQRLAADSVAVLLIAHFPDTYERLETIASELTGGAPVTATYAENLSTDIASRMRLEESSVIDLVVAERHPLLSIDEKLLHFAEELPCRCRVGRHLSIDDPLLKLFAGEWVQQMLKNLGMQENESIESGMVSRRIQGTQKKIEALTFGDSSANSAAEWFEKNLPNGLEG